MKKFILSAVCALAATFVQAQNIDTTFVGSFVSGALNGETILGNAEINDLGHVSGTATPLPAAFTDGSNGIFEDLSFTFLAPAPLNFLPPTLMTFDLSNATGATSATFDGDRLFGFTYAGSSNGTTLLATYDATESNINDAVFFVFNDGNGGVSQGTLTLPTGLTAVPEPSTFAALAGIFALGAVAARRRM